LRPSPDVVYRVLGDEAVLVNLATNDVFELNATGVAVWTLVEEGHSVDQIVDTLIARFDVDRATAEHEVATLLGKLVALRVVDP
jgi:hypothetical protein